MAPISSEQQTTMSRPSLGPRRASSRASLQAARRGSFRQQMVKEESLRLTLDSVEDTVNLAVEIEDATNRIVKPFQSKFDPSEMRQLALVAHNHMKPAMKEFIETYSEVLKKFRITGTLTTMRMCKSLWGENNPDVEYGLTCTSGPLGGDAQIAALMCMEGLGGLIFFVDPLSAHPHQADIDSLIRLANCGNITACLNPTSAMSLMYIFKTALESGDRGLIPSFFDSFESPAVEAYMQQQERALAAVVGGKSPRPSLMAAGPSMYFPGTVEDDRSEETDTFDEDEELDHIIQTAPSIGIADSLVIMDSYHDFSDKQASPASQAGPVLPDEKKNKKTRGFIKQVKSSMRRLNVTGR